MKAYLLKHSLGALGLAAALCSAAPGCGGTTTTPDAAKAADMAVVANQDLGTVSFMQVETQVFVASCGAGPRGGRTCHEKSPPEGGMDLTLGNAFDALVNKPAFINPNKMRVVPFSPDTSFLWQKITGKLTATEGNPMPFDGKNSLMSISPDQLAMVRQWIAEGAPNN